MHHFCPNKGTGILQKNLQVNLIVDKFGVTQYRLYSFETKLEDGNSLSQPTYITILRIPVGLYKFTGSAQFSVFKLSSVLFFNDIRMLLKMERSTPQNIQLSTFSMTNIPRPQDVEVHVDLRLQDVVRRDIKQLLKNFRISLTFLFQKHHFQKVQLKELNNKVYKNLTYEVFCDYKNIDSIQKTPSFFSTDGAANLYPSDH